MPKKPSISKYDIVKEVGSICAGNSTLAFSQLIGRPIQLDSPHLELIKFGNIGKVLAGADRIVVGIHAKILSGLEGRVSLLFKEKSVSEFVSIFTLPEKLSCAFLTELGISTIKETGNVIISAYSGAMSLLLNVPVIPSIPILSSGPMSEVVTFGFNAVSKNEEIFVHTMTFKDKTRKISGSFYLLLEPKAVQQISTAMLERLKQVKFTKK